MKMKINVTGRGRVPGLGGLAPLYDREADISLIKRILAYRVFYVYDASTGLQITSKNVDEYANVDDIDAPPVVIKKNPIIAKQEQVVDTTPVKPQETYVVEDVTNVDTTEVSTVTSDATVVEPATSEEDTIEVNVDIENPTTEEEDIIVATSEEVTEEEDEVTTEETNTTSNNVNNKKRHRRRR